MRFLLSVGFAVATTGGVARAQNQPPTCSGEEHRQFDFWIGDWSVTVMGREAGRNLVTLEESGCLIHEHWTATRGGTGQSFNFYDRQDGRWHQVWVSSAGSVLRLSGSRAGNQMKLTGETARSGGGSTQHRLTFTRNDDGTVRQFWESSNDGGATWTVAFDGLYRKKP